MRGSIAWSCGRRFVVVVMGALAGWQVCAAPAAADVIVFQDANMFQLTKEQTEQQLVSSVFRNQRTVAAARKNAEDALGVQVDFVAMIGTLSDKQRAKLELAGQGDICRFFGDFGAVLQAADLGPMPQQQWQQAWMEVSQQLQPLQARYNAGLHGEDSLFRKTIPSALSPDQLLAFQKLEQERTRKHYRALVKATLAAIDGTVPLTAKQREQIIEVLMKKPALPPRLAEGQNQYQFVLFQMWENQDDLKPLFSENEWKVMQKILQQGRMFERLLLRQGGIGGFGGFRPMGLQGGIRMRAVERNGRVIVIPQPQPVEAVEENLGR